MSRVGPAKSLVWLLTGLLVTVPVIAKQPSSQWQDACSAVRSELELSVEGVLAFDMDAARDAAADAAVEAAGELGDWTLDEMESLRGAARGLADPDAYPASLGADVVRAASRAALRSMGQAFAGIPHGAAIQAFEAIRRRLDEGIRPIAASASTSSGFGSCGEARSLVGEVEGQILSMSAQRADLDYLLRSESMCPALSGRTYQRLGSGVARFDEIAIRLGMALDAASLGGTVNAAELLGRNRRVAELAMSINARLDVLGREAEAAARDLDRRRANLEGNLANVVRPAAASLCGR